MLAPSLTVHCHWGAIASSLAIKETLRRPLPSHGTVHHRRVAVHHRPMLSIHPLLSCCRRAVHHCPSPLSPLLLRCRHAVHCRPLSVAVESPLHRPLLSLPSSHQSPMNCRCAIHRPSPSSIDHHLTVNCRCAVNCHQDTHRRCTLNRRLLLGWLSHCLSSCQCFPSTDSGVSTRHVQCLPHQCVDDLGSHTCSWSAQGFLPYSKYDVNGLILYGRYQGPLATGHCLVGLHPATLSEKWHLLRCHQMTHESAQQASRTDILNLASHDHSLLNLNTYNF